MTGAAASPDGRLLVVRTYVSLHVFAVEPDGPAAEAGVEEGDLLIAYEGKPVTSVDDLHRALTEEKIGRSARLTVVRERGAEDLFVTPGETKI